LETEANQHTLSLEAKQAATQGCLACQDVNVEMDAQLLQKVDTSKLYLTSKSKTTHHDTPALLDTKERH